MNAARLSLSSAIQQPRTGPTSFIHYVGKCDCCGRFHVKCLTCDEMYSLEDDDGERQCGCRMPWFWMASIEEDEHGHRSTELHAVLGLGKVITTDRRPI